MLARRLARVPGAGRAWRLVLEPARRLAQVPGAGAAWWLVLEPGPEAVQLLEPLMARIYVVKRSTRQ